MARGCCPESREFDTGHDGRISVKAKCKSPVYGAISVHAKKPQVVEIHPEPCTTVPLIARFASGR